MQWLRHQSRNTETISCSLVSGTNPAGPVILSQPQKAGNCKPHLRSCQGNSRDQYKQSPGDKNSLEGMHACKQAHTHTIKVIYKKGKAGVKCLENLKFILIFHSFPIYSVFIQQLGHISLGGKSEPLYFQTKSRFCLKERFIWNGKSDTETSI